MYIFLLVLFLPSISSICDSSLLSNCDRCCGLLYQTTDCGGEDVFRVKMNGNGALGAIWDDSAVTVVVRNGCLMEMWDLRNQTGAHRSFGLEGIDVYQLDRYSFDRRPSSLRCKCRSSPE